MSYWMAEGGFMIFMPHRVLSSFILIRKTHWNTTISNPLSHVIMKPYNWHAFKHEISYCAVCWLYFGKCAALCGPLLVSTENCGSFLHLSCAYRLDRFRWCSILHYVGFVLIGWASTLSEKLCSLIVSKKRICWFSTKRPHKCWIFMRYLHKLHKKQLVLVRVCTIQWPNNKIFDCMFCCWLGLFTFFIIVIIFFASFNFQLCCNCATECKII